MSPLAAACGWQLAEATMRTPHGGKRCWPLCSCIHVTITSAIRAAADRRGSVRGSIGAATDTTLRQGFVRTSPFRHGLKLSTAVLIFSPCLAFFSPPDERPVTCPFVLVVERAVRRHGPNWSIIGNRSAQSRGKSGLSCAPA